MNHEPSDPTIQAPLGTPEAATGSWLVSLSEIDAMGRKAARGAGYSWGMAEEAGRAARWLAACRQPGPSALAALLTALDGHVGAHAPVPQSPLWASRAGTLCPVGTGAALSDRAEAIAGGERIALAPVLRPLLLVPFLCRAARDLDCAFRLEAPGVSLVAAPEGPTTLDWAPLLAPSRAGIGISATPAPDAAALGHGDAAFAVDAEVWRKLDRFAHCTYAPASAASRAAAGAGQRDND